MATTLSKAGHIHTYVTQVHVVHCFFVSCRYPIRKIRYRADSFRDVGLEMDRSSRKNAGFVQIKGSPHLQRFVPIKSTREHAHRYILHAL